MKGKTLSCSVEHFTWISLNDLGIGVLAITKGNGNVIYKNDRGDVCLADDPQSTWTNIDIVQCRILPRGTKITVELEQE